ncbi:MAG TPA: tetratricopeptide repeat protein [Urbifossiella sp.]|nr:tetratricopeptide repeat protein [Urbifossiella sp.]
MSFNVMTPAGLFDRIKKSSDGRAPGRAPFTLVLGAGFSYGVIPTTAQVVREDLPWWVWCQREEEGGPTPWHYLNLKEADFPARVEGAKGFWADVLRDWRAGPPPFALGTDGLPTLATVGEAYRFALSATCISGLDTPAQVRRYFGDIIRRIRGRLNAAHLYLAALVAAKPKLFGTVFTTNFDPLLQRSLQLVNAPYYVSDRPDSMEYAGDDDVTEAMHVVHPHGSIYQPLLLNSPDEIDDYADRNREKFQEYFRTHAVLVVGYSGWDDAITRALAGVRHFDHNLYWADRGDNPEASGLTPLAKDILEKHRNAFYVPIAGADTLLAELHLHLTKHSLPEVFREPILVAQKQLDLCDLTGVKLLRIASRSASAPTAGADGGGTGGLSAVVTADTLDLGDEVKGVRKRLEAAQDLFTGKTSTDPNAVLAAETRRRFAVGSDHYFSKRYGEALEEFEFVVPNRKYLDPTERTQVLYRRGVTYGERGEADRAVADYTAVIDDPDAPADQRARARINRGVNYGRRGEADREIADYTAVIDDPGAPADERAKARYNRGVTYGRRGEADRAVADFTAVIDDPDAPADQRAKARYNRGVAHGERGEADREIADYTAVIDDPGAPAQQRAKARFNRGVTYGERGEADRAVADYTAVIDDPDAPAEQRAKARVNRGVTYGERGEADREIADYTAFIDDPNAPADLRVKATRWRDQLLAQQQPLAPEPAAPSKRRPSKKRSGGKKADPPAEPDTTADPTP